MNRRAVRVLACVLVVIVGLLVGAGIGTATETPGSAGAGATASSGALDGDALEDASQGNSPFAGYDNLVLEAAIRGNGSAATTVEYRYRLDDGNQTVDWEALQENVTERPEAYVEWFESEWKRTLETAENDTGRAMAVNGTTVEVETSSTPTAYGTVRFSFRWTGFAHVEVNRIEAGDALHGFMLDERTRLVLSWPEEYERTAIQPEPDDPRDNAVIWDGEETQEFVDGEPRLELIQGGERVEAAENDALPAWLAGAGVLALAIVAAGGWWVAAGRRRADEPEPAAAPATTEAEPETQEPPLELLSNEERVLRLLRERGGRIKQQEVVSELDWTEAKTSQVVGGLREDDAVEVFRIGRENVLSLPDDDE